jgi:hypothetical protein
MQDQLQSVEQNAKISERCEAMIALFVTRATPASFCFAADCCVCSWSAETLNIAG